MRITGIRSVFSRSVSPADRAFSIVNGLLMVFVTVVTLYPFLNVLAISLNDSMDTIRGGIYVWPRKFTLQNYSTIFQFGTLLVGFRNSVLRTLLGTVLGVLSCSMLAYVLSRKDFQGRKFLSTYLAITMYVSGGLIPNYILIRNLHLMNTFWVYVLPGMVVAFNVFVIRSYMDGIPYELQESAKLSGANDLVIFWRIILPLSKPVLATIALFVAVGQWNSWFDTYLYNGSNPALTTLQYELMKILQSTTTGNNVNVHAQNVNQLMGHVSPESVKMAITMVVTVPILFVYPFLQRYFIKGMIVGAVKS